MIAFGLGSYCIQLGRCDVEIERISTSQILTYFFFLIKIDVTDAINAAVNQHVNDVGVDNAGAINVIDDDLHISDDSDDEQPQEQPIVPPQQPRQPPPPTPRRDADDGIWF